ncbi:glycosyltransferase family 2 protein, partial [Patescibacteria group bacterium]|nr:glycosyltransferase family 2 protein [Patescibacteria group bacterium]
MIFIVLPAYNEEETIGPLCQRLKQVMKEDKLSYRVLVVNDGSKDNTAKIVARFRKKMPLEIIDHRKNLGLSEAIKSGLINASKKAKSGDVIVTMDSDNTHTPGLILRMIRMIREGSDVVIASRYQHDSRIRGVPFFRQIISFGASFLFRVFFPIKGVRDYTCGYRAYKATVLKQALRHYGEKFFDQPGFSVMVDILLKMRKLDIIATEAPLILRYDLKHSTSKMNIGKTIK